VCVVDVSYTVIQGMNNIPSEINRFPEYEMNDTRPNRITT